MTTFRHLSGLLLALLALPAAASDYPLTVRSCDRDVTFDQAPQRVVSHDINMTSMLITLGLRDRMAGYTGISGWKTLDPAFKDALGDVPELASRYPSMETLLNVDADLYFAGWNYGMRVGGAVTPATLQPFGIPVYELSESCSWVMEQQGASLDDLYRDLLNLGRIFSVENRAETLVGELRERIEAVHAAVKQAGSTPRVFLYDSGEDRPTTSGRMGMPQALIETAGGHNVMDDVTASWTQVNWESVVERDPEVIVIVDYGPRSWQQKRDFLLSNPALQAMTAIREQRFVVLSYLEVTPSVDNAKAIEKIAAGLHPQSFQSGQH
ncbi:iron ABC transporter substrate-binding protein [Pseudomonas daroniae]|uniref:Iron ABC transporter substrate-binding protein n=1 Tax=Phytopseudomonas daroniae TaxID=2487519 RepID=A0A4Q9QJW8_9GAMM|nr:MULTISPECIES: ABC transporter substrate-binding protein [Pseudomonas]TBU75805.1 iron ABC transporter substrate-binding protein [Pseudomonas daroniae]TBU80600.1 iron ABC transporter substrate-binding protein [Pseudomonas sp. FRB 228]TBU89575.1 iron ABC transporter substrate-binding protein [Pseudomonas daroniae]